VTGAAFGLFLFPRRAGFAFFGSVLFFGNRLSVPLRSPPARLRIISALGSVIILSTRVGAISFANRRSACSARVADPFTLSFVNRLVGKLRAALPRIHFTSNVLEQSPQPDRGQGDQQHDHDRRRALFRVSCGGPERRRGLGLVVVSVVGDVPWLVVG
jgi:hypothetical protein